jgi:hypothetical protein
MRIDKVQSEQILELFGVWATAACDRCGNVIGAVRWTRRGEPGEWCSELCRDGDRAERKSRLGGRPRKYRTEQERRNAKTEQQRDYRHGVLSVEKTPSQVCTNKELANAKNASLASPPYPGSSASLEGSVA